MAENSGLPSGMERGAAPHEGVAGGWLVVIMQALYQNSKEGARSDAEASDSATRSGPRPEK